MNPTNIDVDRNIFISLIYRHLFFLSPRACGADGGAPASTQSREPRRSRRERVGRSTPAQHRRRPRPSSPSAPDTASAARERVRPKRPSRGESRARDGRERRGRGERPREGASPSRTGGGGGDARLAPAWGRGRHVRESGGEARAAPRRTGGAARGGGDVQNAHCCVSQRLCETAPKICLNKMSLHRLAAELLYQRPIVERHKVLHHPEIRRRLSRTHTRVVIVNPFRNLLRTRG
mmetsp:Transcript_8993/g.29546  ORF Transcript_8993/g.29546 Transcript_8993/m.29546 type:complete len:235 (-) Transcript_8993:310-1014(-)